MANPTRFAPSLVDSRKEMKELYITCLSSAVLTRHSSQNSGVVGQITYCSSFHLVQILLWQFNIPLFIPFCGNRNSGAKLPQMTTPMLHSVEVVHCLTMSQFSSTKNYLKAGLRIEIKKELHLEAFLFSGGKPRQVRTSLGHFQKGDVVGVLLDLTVPQISFTVNGLAGEGLLPRLQPRWHVLSGHQRVFQSQVCD